MTDDDLTRRLEAWAGATDPDADPITAAEVIEAPVVPIRRLRPRRMLAVAAALLVVLGLGAAVVVTGDDDADEVITDTTTPDGPRTQIVIDATGLDPAWELTVHRYSLIGPDGQELSGPLLPGVSLIVDQPLAAGRWTATFLTYDCTGTITGCGRPDLDGTPEDVAEAPERCEETVDIGPTASHRVISYGFAEDGIVHCTLQSSDAVPALTVPPAWSVRPPLPWSCGNGSFDADMRIVDDPPSKQEAFECFQSAAEEGTGVEIPVVEVTDAEEPLTRSWWRVLPEPIDGDRFEIIREQGWVRVLCHGLAIEQGDADVPSPEGGISGYRYTSARPTGCTDEEPLPLDLPPLDPTAPSTTTTTGPPAPGTIDVVLDVDLSPFIEGGARRWVIQVDGEEVASGPLTETGSRTGETPDVQQVADDLAAPEGATVAVQIESFDCVRNLADRCRPDHMGPVAGATGGATCTAQPEVGREGPILIVTVRDRSCPGAWTTEPATLTVPTAFTLRPTGDECGDLGDDERWGECLANSVMGAGGAERTVRIEGVRTTYSAQADGALIVFRRTEAPGGVVEWTSQRCGGAQVDAAGRVLTPAGCEAEVSLPVGS